jgi:hypothetical protein
MTATVTDYLVTFFTSQTANVTTNPVSVPFNTAVLKVWGTWGGANIKLQTGVPGDPATFIDVTDSSGNPIVFTKNTQLTLGDIVLGDNLLAILSAAGGATNLNATLQRI